MPTDAETVLSVLRQRLDAATDTEVLVLRNEDPADDEIPDRGCIVIRDGDPGDPEQVLGGFQSCYYEHQIDIEVFVKHGKASVRDERYAVLVKAIGIALAEDETLGGIIQGITYGQPAPITDRIAGGHDIKSAVISLVAEYDTASPIV